MADVDVELISSILSGINGPIMTTIFFVGILLNSVTIFILYRTKIPAKKDSYANASNPKRKLSRTLTNSTLGKDSTTSSLLMHEERKLTLPVDKMMLHRHEEIWHLSMLRKQPRRPRIYIYLLWMSACDVAIIGCAFMNFSIPTIFKEIMGIYAITVPIWYTLSNASLVASLWLMLILVNDRYRALCSRLFKCISIEHHSYIQIHIKLGIVCFLSILFVLPRFFELSVYYDENEQIYFIALTSLIESSYYQIGYRIFCSLVFYSLIPYIIVFVMLTKICIILKRASQKRAEMLVNITHKMINSESDILIIVLTVRFLVSRLLLILLDVVECLIESKAYSESPILMLCNSVNNLLVVFTSATTFFVYVIVSEKFRYKVWDILRLVTVKNVL